MTPDLRNRNCFVKRGPFRGFICTVLFDDGRVDLLLKNGFGSRVSLQRPSVRSLQRPFVPRKRRKGYKKMIMIGDGATDLDARLEGPAKAFIGYGAAAEFQRVQTEARAPGGRIPRCNSWNNQTLYLSG